MLPPFQKVAPCSNAVFITLAAAGWSRPFQGIERPTDLGQLDLALDYTSVGKYVDIETYS